MAHLPAGSQFNARELRILWPAEWVPIVGVSQSFRRATLLALPYYVQIYRHQRPHQFIYSLLLRAGGGGGACVSGLQH